MVHMRRLCHSLDSQLSPVSLLHSGPFWLKSGANGWITRKNGEEEEKITKLKLVVSAHRKYLSQRICACVCVCVPQSLFCIQTGQDEGKSPCSEPVATKSCFLVARLPGIDEAALGPGSKHSLLLPCFHGSQAFPWKRGNTRSCCSCRWRRATSPRFGKQTEAQLFFKFKMT